MAYDIRRVRFKGIGRPLNLPNLIFLFFYVIIKEKTGDTMKMILLFVILSIINVIFSTVRSLTTIKSSKGIAAFISAGYFAFYNIMLIYTVADFPMWQKCVVTFMCNLVGVFVVKWAEERLRRDQMWKIEMTVPSDKTAELHAALDSRGIPHNYIPNLGKYTAFNLYCATQKESAFVKDLAIKHKAKFFALCFVLRLLYSLRSYLRSI